MNRSQSRKFVKSAKQKGVDRSVAELYVRMQQKGSQPIDLHEGDKVQLNLSAMKRHPDYSRLSDERRRFVESHLDNVFTVVFDKRKRNDPSVVCLDEDPNGWLFWTGDLTKVSE